MTLPEKIIYGLVGYQVKHSLSPAMHNAAFASLKINAEYRLFELRPEELEGFIKSLPLKKISGLNVTIPYKEKALSFLDVISKEASLIGAVNTIRVNGDKLEGFNTDAEGFIRHLKQDLGFKAKGKTAAIIGAGGAAKAISICLSKEEPKVLAVYDVNRKAASELIAKLKANFRNTDFREASSIEGLNIESSDLLVNATPIGMKDSDPCPVSEGLIHKGILVYDLIYNPEETKLLRAARARGALASNGLGMLLYQGMASFEIWTGKKAPKEAMQLPLINRDVS